MDVERSRSSGTRLALGLILLGAVVGVIGPLLSWVNVGFAGGGSAGGPIRQRLAQLLQGLSGRTTRGFNTPDGRFVLALSVAIGVAAVFGLLGERTFLRLGAVALSMVLAMGTLALTLTDLASNTGVSAIDAARRSGAQVGRLAGAIQVSSGAGVWVAMAGSAIAAIAGLTVLWSDRRWTSTAERSRHGHHHRSETLPVPTDPSGPGPQPTEVITPPVPPTEPLPPAQA
jgi:hypothetical protein